jgi:hypothetical protein
MTDDNKNALPLNARVADMYGQLMIGYLVTAFFMQYGFEPAHALRRRKKLAVKLFLLR